jgi:phage-related protein
MVRSGRGSGCPRSSREIRIRTADGAFRVIYVVEREDAVYVLHAFQKKTERTSRQDIERGRARYRMIR